MECNGVSTGYQDWYCSVCGYQKSVCKKYNNKRNPIKTYEKISNYLC